MTKQMKPIVIAVFLTFFFLIFFKNTANTQPDVFTNKLGMKFVLIPSGFFTMGSPESELGHKFNETQHRVTISRSFYIMETEVTQGQFKKLVGFNPSSFEELGENYPVDTVSWNQCIEFIRVLNKWEGTDKYRLPTEAEWEYTCRAGTTKAFASGSISQSGCNIIEPGLFDMAWYCGNSGLSGPARDFRPHPVKTRKPNNWGIYDMHGNVQEWVQDSCKGRDFWRGRTGVITNTYKDNIVDPLSSIGKNRVIRGGAWHQPPIFLRSASRAFYKPVAKRNSLGFRIVREK